MSKFLKNWVGKTFSPLRVSLALLATLAFVLGFGFYRQTAVEAAAPAMGTITDVSGTMVSWTGDRAGSSPNGEATCTTGDATAANCDLYTLTVQPGTWTGKRITIRFDWTLVASDYDMALYRETNGTAGFQGAGATGASATPDAVVSTSGQGTTVFEEIVLSPPNNGGTYYVRAIYFAGGGPADQYRGSAKVLTPVIADPTPPASACALPTFDNYQPPVGYPKRDNSGEPSIGINWNTNNVMTMSRLQANRTIFNDSTSPANPTTGASWFARAMPTVVTGLDPIGYTDPITGRSIFGELNGNFTNGVLSDDDLATILPLPTSGISPTSSVDHQTIVSGPPSPNGPPGRQPIGPYPHVWYYAAQNIALATVSASFDGGLTYEPATPAYTLSQCGGLHGHLKVGPDGSVYLPNKGCQGKQGFARSDDNGTTWNVFTVPTSTAGSTDPSVGVGAGGRVYLGYSAGDDHPHVVVSDNKGATWRNDFDLGLAISPNITAAVFPHVVVGDRDRAAIFFVGTTSTAPGDPVGADTGTIFAGTWFPYIATTCDGGKSWSVIRADNDPLNPGIANPVQQGVVCTSGTTCPAGTRNLLDFNELAVDARGRITAVYSDGCNFGHPCINSTDNMLTKAGNQATARLTIIRQRGGTRLFSEYDSAPSAPLTPFVNVDGSQKGNQLLWGTPDDQGAAISHYRIYRGTAGGKGEQLIAQVKYGSNTFVDRVPPSRGNYYYHVTAVNKLGESPLGSKTFSRQE